MSNLTEQKKQARTPNGRRKQEQDPMIRFSKALSKVLRHTAQSNGLRLRPDGFVSVDDLLELPQFKSLSLEMLKKIVDENEKKRFSLAETDRKLFIRANQGHTIRTIEVPMTRVSDASLLPKVVHGTRKELWPKINKEGLSRMKRNHIHCATGLFGEPGVISGIRKSCSLYIYIDVLKAMQHGIEFYQSENGVILTEGRDGVLSPSFFKKVETNLGEVLLEADAKTETPKTDNSLQKSANTESVDDLDPFSEDMEALTMHDLNLVQEKHSNFGYSEGIVKGKMEVAQSGFDDGYSQGAIYGFEFGKKLGELKAKLLIVDDEKERALLQKQLEELEHQSEFSKFVFANKESIRSKLDKTPTLK
ncbi:tRNA 2'-phosphotransferase Tpt1/ CIA machinery [Schizosaccharomyces osmophilus]|uniref:2'-phosphotransferase n=1 Tax=Schizosaccharomyces osmophilus TaxID=2545709 RepID=A0AAE9WFF3_9SCHI|nr:tRNA 2'-phosphotransferase Tpt1/ CIA machinery [Schizosaccharomyces osmophilus]WBW74232.1 tRNA 2'-phosphotransferase Tpt1/ CIA machinery [Schizosaccharomyces osmophilus]